MRVGTILDLNRVAKDVFISIFSKYPISQEVERLAEVGAEHIEFTLDLLFSHHKMKEAFTKERERLKEIAKDLSLTYSFHLPTTGGFCVGSCWEAVRLGSIAWLREFVEWAKPLDAQGYTIHPKALEDVCQLDLGPMEGGWVPMRKVYEHFTESVILPGERESVAAIRSFLDPSKIFLENSEAADFSILGDFPLESGYSVCMDAGHCYLWRQGVKDFVQKYRSVLRHVHLHDVVEEPERQPWGRRDHRPLGTGIVNVQEVITELRSINFKGAVVIEDYFQDPSHSIRFLYKELKGISRGVS